MTKKPKPKDDLDSVMSTQAGRRFVYRMLQYAADLPMGVDTNGTYFLLGRQAVARGLEAELKSQHWHHYMLMLQEQFSDEDGSKSTCAIDELS